MEPGTQRWCIRRSLAWAEAVTATGNLLGIDFGGRRSRYEKPGLATVKALFLKTQYRALRMVMTAMVELQWSIGQRKAYVSTTTLEA